MTKFPTCYESQDMVTMFTDGACSGNPGVGGWGALLRYQGHEKTLYGGVGDTTNNRMELMAVIEGLRALKEPCQVLVTTDSRYVQQGMETWLANWIAKDWKTASKQPVKNQDLWQMLHTLSQQHDLSWQWVKGHSGHPENDQADALARRGIAEYGKG